MCCQSSVLSAAEGTKEYFSLMGKEGRSGQGTTASTHHVILGLNFLDDRHFIEEDVEAQRYEGRFCNFT